MTFTSDNLRGAAFMMACMAGFVLNDTLLKSVAEDVNLFQAIFLRGLVATTLIGVVAWRMGALSVRVAPQDRRTLALRLVGEIAGTFCFLTALFHMPIANATAILQAMPLAVTLSAAVFLGEKVGWRRYLAIAVGFAGVMVIVRPGSEGFTVYSLWALLAVVFVTLRDLSTRRLSSALPTMFVTFCTALAITLAGALVSLGGLLTVGAGWRPVTPEIVLTLAGAAVMLLVGYSFGVAAMRVGEIAFVSPFRYSGLIWAILLGMAVFAEFPDFYTLLGAAIVVGTGTYTFYREQRLARRTHPSPIAPRL
jgi:drug/metabolite transporter (DMT)-like permease